MRAITDLDDNQVRTGMKRKLKPKAPTTGGIMPPKPALNTKRAQPKKAAPLGNPGVAGYERGSPLAKPMNAPAKRMNKLAGIKSPRNKF